MPWLASSRSWVLEVAVAPVALADPRVAVGDGYHHRFTTPVCRSADRDSGPHDAQAAPPLAGIS